MIIETKLNIQDEVFFIHNSKVYTTKIAEIATSSEEGTYGNITTKTYYRITNNPAGSQYKTMGFTDSELFETKAELLETL